MKCRIFLNLPLLLINLVGIVSYSYCEDVTRDEFRNAFDPYVGIWKGEYRIYSQEDTLLNQFKVNRNYWWEGDVLLGRVSYDFGQVKQTYFHRIILSEGVPFSFVTDTAASQEIKSALKGEMMKGTLVWSRVLPKGSLPVRISERIVDGSDGRFIEFWGNQEAKDPSGESYLVRIEGFAAYVPESRKFVIATEEVDGEAPVVQAAEEEIAAEPMDDDERSRRFSSLKPDRRGSLRSTTKEEQSEPSMITPEPEPEPEIVVKPEEVEKPAKKQSKKPKKEKKPEVKVTEEVVPVSEPEPTVEPKELLPDPDILAAINTLNIVGINDTAGEECIVVDYFLLYEVGDRIDFDKACFFAGLDEKNLYFEDADGYRYLVLRKDLGTE